MTTPENIIYEVYDMDRTIKTFRVMFFITDKCNLQCSYCYNTFPRNNIDLNLDYAYEFVKKIYHRNYNLVEIYLIGGETCLHPKLLEFCEKVHNLSSIFRFVVFSNFTQPISIYQKLLTYNTELTLTLHDNTNPEWLKEKIKLLDPEKCKNNVRLVIMYELNCWKESLAVFDYFKQYESNFKTLFFSTVDNHHMYRMSPTTEQANEYKKRITCVKTSKITLKYKDGHIEDIPDNYFFIKKENQNFNKWLCNTGKEFLYVYVDGNIFLCDQAFGHSIGNIYNIENFIFPTHGVICPYTICPCLYDVYKKNIFNLKTPFNNL